MLQKNFQNQIFLLFFSQFLDFATFTVILFSSDNQNMLSFTDHC